MQLLALLMPLIGLITFAGFIWLVVVAFKRGTAWGVLVLLLSPIAAIVFAVKHWQESKTPFLVYIGSSAAGFVVVMIFIFSLGAPMIEMAQQMSEGEVTDEEAAAFFEKQMDRMENSGLMSAADKAEMKQMRGVLQEIKDEQGGEADAEALTAALARAETLGPESADEEASEASFDTGAVTTTRITRSRKTVGVNEIDAHVGERFRVITKDGIEFLGRYKGQSDGALRFEKYINAGTLDIYLGKNEIRTLQPVKRRSS